VATLAAEAVGGRRAEDRERKTEPKPTPPPSSILTGIDILEREQFARLKGKRVGLVTNHSGRDRDGRATIDLLHQAEGVKLVALFSPEHGIRGAVDAKVADSKDEKTGLPVYSLYGQRLKPTPETLQGIDTLVYDIQDAGCRYYTYISTLGGVLEAATAAKIKLIVLDRPNPIGGVAVAGPMLDAGRESFVGWHRLPVRHGLTVGELALLFNAERKIGCDLEVVKMEGWHRADLFDRTGLTWVNPSPNLRSLTQALLYPGIGLLETTNLSVGRGTDQPFEWIGAPWLDGRQLADALRVRNVPGVRWVPVSRTPTSSVFKGQACGGVQIIVDDWARFEPLRTGLTVAVELRRLYPDAWQVDKYDRLLGNKATLDGLKEGRSAEELERAWQPGLAEFLEVRKRYLYYEGSAGWAESVARGVPYLRKSQAADGTWSANVGRYKVGITGLALLALLSAGEGGEAVDRAVSALLKAQRPDGLIVGPDTGSGPMYDHGIATFALAQAALASPQLAAEIKPAVEKAVAVILKAQCRNGITRGGWRYRPEPTDGDMSVTPWQLLALRSARDLGCEVPDQALSDAFEFLRRCQNSTGGISYRPASGSATLGCTAGGVVVWALFAIVRAPRPDLEKAVDYLTEHPPRWGENFFFYTAYHQAHALALIGDDGGGVLIREGNLPTGGPFGPRAMGIPGPVEPEAKRTAPSEARQRLLGLLRDRQSADGGWPLVGTEGSVGRSYVTAMAVLALTSGDGRLSVNRRPAEKK
jgi:uncharacterized protein YbbC (DUF1343 family)